MSSLVFNRRDFTACALAFGLQGFARSAGAAFAPKVLIVGDSLSAEYGLPRGSGWVAMLAERLQRTHPGAGVVNASISGETTAGGRTRLPALLAQHSPSHVVIELGGNDALRGLALEATAHNLQAMASAARKAQAKVLLLGMQMPANYGAAMTRAFAQMYPRVARASGAALVPFFLKGVADDADPALWFQADRIHPNAQAQPLLLANVWPHLKGQLP